MIDAVSRISAPVPEVQHISTLFRRIRSGEVRIPAFQRGFSWEEKQIIDLLDSIYRGYPIGSLLLWKVENKQFKVEKVSALPLPDVSNDYPVSFVLDGLQRITSLYGVFHHSASETPDIFNVVYDLDKNTFRHFDPQDRRPTDIPLSALFSPKQLLEEHARLVGQQNGDQLLSGSIELQAVFQDYMVPTVTITHKEVKEVIEIFARINSTGTSLTPVDFMRALTWSSDFDLTAELDRLQAFIGESGFELTQQTLTKAVAVIAGKDPVPDSMLELRESDAKTLQNYVRSSEEAIVKSIQFLREEDLCRSSEFLAYEGQLLCLVKIFAEGGFASAATKDEVRRWYWGTSLNEDLRGKPDNYVARLISRVSLAARDPHRGLNSKLLLTVDDLVTRRLIRGKALSCAVLGLFGLNNARSLVTGDVINKSYYLDYFEPTVVQPIFTLEKLASKLDRPLTSSRLLANIFICPFEDNHLFIELGFARMLARLKDSEGAKYDSVLASQFLNEEILDLIAQGNVELALQRRATLMWKFSSELVTGMA